MSGTSLSQDLREFIRPFEPQWDASTPLPERELLRLAILRELAGALHARKSASLATGERNVAFDLGLWEQRMEEIRKQGSLDGSIQEALSRTPLGPPRELKFQSEFLTSLDVKKLDRYDRAWEKALAAEALHCGWEFWNLEAGVEITQVQSWHFALSKFYWPQGIVLFVESLPQEFKGSEWFGSWLIMLKPGSEKKTPPGCVSPKWKIVFPSPNP